MRIFDHPNLDDFKCPVCGTSEDKAIAYLSIYIADYEGIVHTERVHVDCIEQKAYLKDLFVS